jgi:hypothetical protein
MGGAVSTTVVASTAVFACTYDAGVGAGVGAGSGWFRIRPQRLGRNPGQRVSVSTVQVNMAVLTIAIVF